MTACKLGPEHSSGPGLGRDVRVAGVLLHFPKGKGCWFNPQSQHIPVIWDLTPAG